MESRNDDPFKDYAWLAIALFISGLAIWQIPSSLNGIRQEFLLTREGTDTVGKVVWLEAASRCRKSSAGISFVVSGSNYSVRIVGCGAHPDQLSIGSEVKVRYVANNPEIAEATVANASTPRQSVLFVACMWLSVFVSVTIAKREWRKEHPRK